MRIEAIGLTKEFGGRRAVDGLSFCVEPGKVTGFLGPNGAGKSTTLQLMLGLVGGGGRTLFDGRPYRDLPCPVCEVGAVLDAKAFHPRRSARDHLWMLAAAGHLPGDARGRVPGRRVDEVLGQVGLDAVAHRPAGGFSLGMAQRLGLARPCWPAHVRCCWTSRPTASTRTGWPGCGRCCAPSPPGAGPCLSPATCWPRCSCLPTTSW
jgi:ABC-2 type transport system ATP-binding protein